MTLFSTLAMALMAIAIASLALWLSMKKSSVVDLAEFSSLDDQLKGLYRVAVVDLLAPGTVDAINQQWISLPAEARANLLVQAKEAVRQYGAMANRQIASGGWFSPTAPKPTRRERIGPGHLGATDKKYRGLRQLIAVPNQTANGKKESFESDAYML